MSVASGLRVWDEQGLGWNHADVFCLYMFVCFRKCDQRAGLVRAGRGKRLFGFAILRTAVAAHRVLMFEGFDFFCTWFWFTSKKALCVLGRLSSSEKDGHLDSRAKESPKAVWAFTSLDAFRRPLRLYPVEGLKNHLNGH